MIARPSFMDEARAAPLEVANDVAVGIEDADLGHGDETQLFLAPCFAQQRIGPEY